MSSLRLFFGCVMLSLAAAILGIACTPSLDDGTVCGQAAEMLGTCGVLLPFTTDPSACTGDQEAVARCITSAGSSCDALAGLSTHLNDCLGADGGTTFPTSVPGLGLGDLDAAAFTLDGSSSATAGDAASSPGSDADAAADAATEAGANADAAPGDDGGSDSSTGPATDSGAALLDVTDSVASGETKAYQTVRLGPGNYLFTLTGQAGAQLSVRKVEDSTTEDCVVHAEPSGGTCLDVVSKSAVLYADVSGDGSAATFHLVAVTESP